MAKQCTLDTNVYIVISTRMMDSVFCLVNVLFCVTYWNVYINVLQIAKIHTSPLLAFNMLARPTC